MWVDLPVPEQDRITLRDLFAIHAVSGAAAQLFVHPPAALARCAYLLADAMLEERARKESP